MSLANILLVEDNPEQVALMDRYLGFCYQIVAVSSAEAARVELDNGVPDLFLLDVELPGLDGYGFAAELRKTSATEAVPIVFLSSRTEVRDKVLGFAVGAQDYVEKPVDPDELRARIAARLGERSTSRKALSVADLTLDVERMCVSAGSPDEVVIELTATEFRLLHYLMLHRGHVVSRAQLIEGAWNGRIVSERTIDTHMWALRRKLEVSRCSIETVRGAGYRFS